MSKVYSSISETHRIKTFELLAMHKTNFEKTPIYCRNGTDLIMIFRRG